MPDEGGCDVQYPSFWRALRSVLFGPRVTDVELALAVAKMESGQPLIFGHALSDTDRQRLQELHEQRMKAMG